MKLKIEDSGGNVEIEGDAPDVLAVLAVLRGARRVEVDDDVCKVDGVPTPGAHQRARLGPCYVSGCHSDATRTDRARGPLCDYHGNW